MSAHFKLRRLFTAQEIEAAISRLAAEIRKDYHDKNPLLIGTGLTTSFLADYLRKKRPVSLKLCALTDKPSQRQVPVPIDYLGFSVPNKFLVGYGLDFDEKFRNLPDICVLEDEKQC